MFVYIVYLYIVFITERLAYELAVENAAGPVKTFGTKLFS